MIWRICSAMVCDEIADPTVAGSLSRRTLDKNVAGSNPGTCSSDLSSPPSGWIDVDHVMEQQWRNGLGRPDRLCGRRFDPERTFFTNQDKFVDSGSMAIPLAIRIHSPLV